MVLLIFVTLSVVGSAAVLWAIFRRFGVEIPFPQTAALVVFVWLGTISFTNLQQHWKRLDEQREKYEPLSAAEAKAVCRGAGVDPEFLAFIGSRIPVRERFYFETASIAGSGEFCVRFLLLPRLEEEDPLKARYLVFWDPPDRKTLDDARRRGAQITVWDKSRALARFP